MWIDDDILKRCTETMALSVFVPSEVMIVLGSGNNPDFEVHVANCSDHSIPIFRRFGGGGTVLLHEGCVVVSLGLWVRQYYQNRLYFELINSAIIECLAVIWPGFAQLSQRGLSDIVYGDRKVAGTSLFRSRNYLLYQASLLVDAKADLIERFLAHPTREPDYRGGRSHADFIIGLNEICPILEPSIYCAHLQTQLPVTLQTRLGEELIGPQPEFFEGLLRRAGCI